VTRERAREETGNASLGVLDIVAVLGVVSPKSRQQAVARVVTVGSPFKLLDAVM